MKNELRVLKKENRRRQAGLSAENNAYIEQVHKYLDNARINPFEREVTRETLIDKAIAAEGHDERLTDTMGSEADFCTVLLEAAARKPWTETGFDFLAYAKSFLLLYTVFGGAMAFAAGTAGRISLSFFNLFLIVGFPVAAFVVDRFLRPVGAFVGDWWEWRNQLFNIAAAVALIAVLWLLRPKSCGVGLGLPMWAFPALCGGGYLLFELLCIFRYHRLAKRRGEQNPQKNDQEH